jgi:16S rRNA (cytosine967-C5)-methyltransferase
MVFASRLQAISEILDLIFQSSLSADRLMHRYMGQRRYMGSKDRSFIGDSVFEILHKSPVFDYFTKKYFPHQGNVGRQWVLMWLYLYYEGYDGEKDNSYAMDPPHDHEKKWLSTLSLEHVPPLSQWGVPEIFHQHWELTFGDQETQKIHGLSLQEKPFIDIRASINKISRDDLKVLLEEHEIPTEIIPLTPWGLRLSKRQSLNHLGAFKEGYFHIQDAGAQHMVMMCDIQKSMTVLDYCAGGGGKSLAIAMLLEGEGKVWVHDKHPERLKDLWLRAEKSHLLPMISLAEDFDTLKNQCDRVLLDVPCTGSGTWRRRPDSKLRWNHDNLDEVLKEQASILENAPNYLKEGGYLIYGTCSVLRHENQDQIQRFLSYHPNFSIIAEKTLYPHIHSCDGFYTAVLKKTSK